MKSRFTDLQFSTTHHTPTDKTPSLGSLFRTKNTISYKNIQADHCQKTLVKNELPIFIFDLSGIKHILNLAHQAIHELRESHPGVESNVIADYRSPWKSHTLNAKLLPLCDVVSSLTTQVSGEGYTGNRETLGLKVFVNDCWGAIYGEGGYAESHNHHPAAFSAIMYLETDESASPIIFGHDQMYPATENTLYIFPGHLQHEVKKNTGKRIMVAMNLYLLPM
jgi:hypothetical protein